MKRAFLIGIFFLGLMGEDLSQAFAATYEIDLAHSSVTFRIRHLMSKVKGAFTQFRGTIDLDSENVANSRAEAVIEAASIDTHIEKRDNHLRSADFFDVEKFPEIKFVSKRVEDGKVIGDLTMHGVTRDVVLEYTFNGLATDPWGKERAGFSAHTTLDRKDFGITYNQILDQGGVLIGENVEIEIEVEAILTFPESGLPT